METETEQQEKQLQLLQGEVQHLQQGNVKVGAVGDMDRVAGATASAAPGEVQHLQQDSVMVGVAGDKVRAAEQLLLLQGEVQHLQKDNVKVGVGDRDIVAEATSAAAPGGSAAPIAGQC